MNPCSDISSGLLVHGFLVVSILAAGDVDESDFGPSESENIGRKPRWAGVGYICEFSYGGVKNEGSQIRLR